MSSIKQDPISPDLRQVEKEIDNYYKRNSLVSSPFGVSIWHILAFYEDIVLFDLLRKNSTSIQEANALADNIVVQIQYPVYWLWISCQKGGTPPLCFDKAHYQAASEFSELANNYVPFESAFTYASRGLTKLELHNSRITSDYDFFGDSRYEAYDRLIKPKHILPDFESGDFIELIEKNLTVSKDSFRYKLGKRLISTGLKILKPIIEYRFVLPDNWKFTNYSIKEFRQVSRVLITLAYIHFIARLIAASQGCEGLGYSNALIVMTHEELLWRLARYSGVKFEIVSHYIEDFTYGSKGIERPDPAIQPLIKLNDKQYAIMPNLIMNSSMERNFTILLNRLPSEKKIYSRLVEEKESLARMRIMEKLSLSNVRFFHGDVPTIPYLPDIDLAIISDEEKLVLIIELKWFIEPAEPREVIEKSEEIDKGISQALRLSQSFMENPNPFMDVLDIDSSYTLFFFVASDNSIGHGKIQNPKIPVIKTDHFIKKTISMGNLKDVIDWLSKREYLPNEGIHYKVAKSNWDIDKWSIEWYEIQPLVEGEFD